MADPAERRPPAWDTARMETVRCDVASATVADGEVLLHFGQRATRADGVQGVQQVQGVRLTPYCAKRLQELLAVLVRDHDRRGGGGG
jgi:hypothetical protein